MFARLTHARDLISLAANYHIIITRDSARIDPIASMLRDRFRDAGVTLAFRFND